MHKTHMEVTPVAYLVSPTENNVLSYTIKGGGGGSAALHWTCKHTAGLFLTKLMMGVQLAL